MRSLADHRASTFEQTMLAHIQRFFAAFGGHDEEAIRETIREGMARCARHGIETEYDMGRFIDMTYLLGRGFDEEPPWAKILGEPADARARMDELCRRALLLEKKTRDSGAAR